jgi:hypothetical protein
VVGAVIGAAVSVPLPASPEALKLPGVDAIAHDIAFDVQLITGELPLVTLAGLTLNVPICGGVTTFTVTDVLAWTPSELLQVSV